MRVWWVLLAVLLLGCSDAADPAPSGDAALVAQGKAVHTREACNFCHNPEGTAPSYRGSEVELEDGRRVARDEAYFRRAILDPRAEVVAGYANNMPDYRARLSEEDIDALVAYLLTLR